MTTRLRSPSTGIIRMRERTITMRGGEQWGHNVCPGVVSAHRENGKADRLSRRFVLQALSRIDAIGVTSPTICLETGIELGRTGCTPLSHPLSMASNLSKAKPPALMARRWRRRSV
jgi:hypothetical protein